MNLDTNRSLPAPDYDDELEFGFVPDDAAVFIEEHDLGYIDGEAFFEAPTPAPVPLKPASAVLSTADIKLLADEGISLDVAEAHGTRSVPAKGDLPAELRSKWDGPGIVFQHHRVDGTTVPQYRPTKPTRENERGKLTKYYLPAASGNSPYISPLQRHLLGAIPNAWIIEGTKACLSVVSLLKEVGRLDDVLVVSVAGAWGGSEGGCHSSDFGRMLGANARVTTFFDADFATNSSVWDAAKTLQEFLEATYGAVVSFASVPVSNKGGVSDWLGALMDRTPAERFAAVERLVERSKVKLPRRPAAKKRSTPLVGTVLAEVSAGGAKVFRDLEMIAEAHLSEDGKLRTGQPLLLGAAIWLTAVHEVFDDLASTTVRAGEFDVAIGIGGQVFNIERVKASQLDNPRWLLSQVPGALGETVTIRPRTEKEIGEAIRASAGRPGVDLPVRRRLTRSGWAKIEKRGPEGQRSEEWRYVTGSGAIGATDTDAGFTARVLEPSMLGFDMPDPHTESALLSAKAVTDTFRAITSFVVDPTPLIAGIGFMASAVMGMKAGGGLCIVGAPGSGKTAQAKFLSSLQVGSWDENSLGNFEGTSNFVAGIGKGVHHATVFVDDLRVRSRPGSSNHRSAEVQQEAFSQIMRRMYGGGSKSRGRAYFDKDSGEVLSKERELTAPCFILTAEPGALPDGHQNSDLERALFVQVTKDSTFVPGGASQMEDLANDGVPQRAWARFIQHIAEEIEEQGMDVFLSVARAQMEGLAEQFRKKYPDVPGVRPHLIAANAFHGFWIFLNFAEKIGDISTEEADVVYELARESVGNAMLDCYKTFQGGAVSHSALDMLVSAVFSGQYWIENLTGSETSARLGKLGVAGHTAGEDVIFVETNLAAKITGLKGKALGVELSEHLVSDEGTYTRKVRVGPDSVRMYAIKRSSWSGLPAGGSGTGWQEEVAARTSPQAPANGDSDPKRIICSAP